MDGDEDLEKPGQVPSKGSGTGPTGTDQTDPASPNTTSRPARPDLHKGSWHRRATRPITWWILALIVLGIGYRWVPASTWVIIHVFTLGVLANSIHVWSQHFVESLLRARPDDAFRVHQVRRIYLFNIGIVVLITGMVGSWLPVVYVGTAAVFAGALWHAIVLTIQIRAAKQSRFRRIIAFYPVAAFLLPVGALLGATSATALLGAGGSALAAPWPERLLLAHLAVSVLGFVGLTVHATLVTFWPVVLRARMIDGQDTAGYIGLWAMTGGVVILATGALTGLVWLATAGVVIYLLAVLAVGWYLLRTAIRKPPAEFSAMSIAVAMVWWVVALAWLAWLLGSTGAASIRDVTVPLLAGFAGQLLFGAMSFLMPTVMRGGPRAVRAGMVEMNRLAAFRLVLINVGLVVYLWPGASSWVPLTGSALAFVGYALFVPILVLAVRRQLGVIRARDDGPAPGTTGAREQPGPGPDVQIAPGRRRNLSGALVGVLVCVLAVGAAVVFDAA